MTQSATYVYCLVQSDARPSLKRGAEGLPGSGPVRALPISRGLWAVVADAPLDRFSGGNLELELQDIEAVSRYALAHAGVIESWFARYPVIPLKLFTLFSSDDRAQRELGAQAGRVRALFSRLRGMEEWGIRITAASEPSASALRGQTPSTGRGYLDAKKRLKDQASAPRTNRRVGAAFRDLNKIATKMRKEAYPAPAQGGPYVAGASFLVSVRRRAPWKKHVSQLRTALRREGHRMDVTGPWPPYHFTTGARRTA